MMKEQSSFYTMVLHIEDDELDPFQLRLLVRFRRRCGQDGVCHESLPNLARGCKMSRAKVISTRAWLVEHGYIRLEEREGQTTVVRCVDRMPENLSKYAPADAGTRTKNEPGTKANPAQKRAGGHAKNDPGGVSKTIRVPSSKTVHEGETESKTHEKEHIKKGVDDEMLRLLHTYGVNTHPNVLTAVCENEYTAAELQALWRHVQSQPGIKNPAAVLVKNLIGGVRAPRPYSSIQASMRLQDADKQLFNGGAPGGRP